MDTYKKVTDSIIKHIEDGMTSKVMPWHRSALHFPQNIASGNRYRGINILLLWGRELTAGFDSNVWGTYRQWQKVGAQVRKGEKAAQVILWKITETLTDDKDTEKKKKKRLLIREHSVFNAHQVEGYTPVAPRPELPESERVERIDAFFRRVRARVLHQGDRAVYIPSIDEIWMPAFSQFASALAYYSILSHEHIHWTGAESRLKRALSTVKNKNYAFEELIAELGGAFLCAALGLPNSYHPENAGYIKHWLLHLREDSKAIFRAARFAEEACDWLLQEGSAQQELTTNAA